MSGVNLRILTERVIDLEKRVAKLEEPRHEQTVEHLTQQMFGGGDKFTVQARGRWWYCVSPEGVRLNERGLSKEDAQKLADDMNGATKEMVDA